jgi:translocation and assembly module TamB
VRPSPDAVIVGTPQPRTPTDWAMHAQVRVILGDDVNVSGFKLNAKVAGEVTVQEQPKQPTLAQGEFRIAAGDYEVYGQKIKIERGRLVYAGGTIDDPGLDMRATRRINDDVLVGVEARGTLHSPRLQLVSEPAMSDTDVLSYLLLGRPSNQASQNEGNLLYRAATGLGLSGGEALARRLGAIFGIRDVRIEQDEKTKTTSLLFGTYLSPRLYVSYGVGLFDAINTLRLRYQLTQHWTVQTESGADTGVDLLYTIER